MSQGRETREPYPCAMASIPVDERLVARLAERAKREGVTVEEVAEHAIEEYLGEPGEGAADPFAFIGAGSNPDVQAEDADKLLAEGFGR